MHIRQLPSGKWQCIVIGPDGKQHPQTFTLKTQASNWGIDQMAKMQRGAFRDPRLGKQTIAKWHTLWEASRVVEPYTLAGDKSSIKLHVLPHWGKWQLAAITRLDVQTWVRRMMADGVGPSAIHRCYKLFASMMRAAVDDDIIAVTPCRNIDLPPVAIQPPKWYTRPQAEAILDRLAEPWKTMALTGFYTGLRWGELAGLHGSRIDWLRSRLFVVEVKTPAGIKEYPKTAASRREVPLTPQVVEALSRHMHGRDRDGVVFTTVTKGREGRHLNAQNWRDQTWWPAVRKAMYEAEAGKPILVPQYPPHSMRHTCASWLVQEGVNLYDVQHLLGHKSYATTQRYAHLAPDSHRTVLTAWERIALRLHGAESA